MRLSFEAGTNPDVAQMQVQNKLQQAMSRLPQAVQSQGVTVTKAGTDLLMVLSLTSEDGSMSATDLGDYIASNLQDIISRVDGSWLGRNAAHGELAHGRDRERRVDAQVGRDGRAITNVQTWITENLMIGADHATGSAGAHAAATQNVRGRRHVQQRFVDGADRDTVGLFGHLARDQVGDGDVRGR